MQAPDDVNDLKSSISNLITLLLGLGRMWEDYPLEVQTHTNAFHGDIVILHQCAQTFLHMLILLTFYARDLIEIHREHICLFKDYIESQYRFGIVAPLSTLMAWRRLSVWYHRDELRSRLKRLHKTVEKLQANFTVSVTPIAIASHSRKLDADNQLG